MSMDETPLTPLELRTQEVQQYQTNIEMFKAIAATLPSELPEHLQSFRTRTDKHAASAEITNLDDLELLSDVWMHDEMNARVRSEMVEMRKAKAILDFITTQQP